MKGYPIIGILVGVIVVLIIVIVSLGIQVSRTSELYSQMNRIKINLEEQKKTLEEKLAGLSQEKKDMLNQIKQKDITIKELQSEVDKLNKLKDMLEENLKNALTKK